MSLINLLSRLYYYSSYSIGPPGCVHGGCIGAVLDETLGWTVFSHNDNNHHHPNNQDQDQDQNQNQNQKQQQHSFEPAVTVNLNVNYRKFIPLNSIKAIEASVEKREGRKIYVSGRIYDPLTNVVHAEATAIFVAVQSVPR